MTKPTSLFLITLVALVSVVSAGLANGRRPSSKLKKLPEEKAVTEETIEFANGDTLTGRIVSVSEDIIRFNSKMMSGRSLIPVSNVKSILFPKLIDIKTIPRVDQIVLPNGDRISLTIDSVNEKALKGETPTGSSIELNRTELEGIIFKKVSATVLEEHFDDPENVRFNAVSGEWNVEDGMYVQKSTASSTYSASAMLTQQGRYRYQWSVDASRRGVTGFYFFAENGTSRNGGNSYYISLSGNSVYLYKCRDDNQQYYDSYTMPSGQGITKLDLEYDSTKGTIVLAVNEHQAMRWKDTEPIEEGRYVILHASGSAGFDDIIISRMDGTRLPSFTSDSDGNDVILFVNGDVLAGTVVSISEENAVMTNEYDPEGVTISISKISSIRFKRAGKSELPKFVGSYRFTTWNDDIITGSILTLDDIYIKVQSNALGELLVPRKLIKRIEAPKEPKL
jgi:hypothetical protein